MQIDAGSISRAARYQFVCKLLLISCALLIVQSAVLGCKKADGKVAVHGRVTYKGEPIDKASLNFFPEKGRSEAATVEEGEYSIELLPSEYTVIVLIGAEVPVGYKEGDRLPPPKITLPEQYTSRLKSTLKASVAKGQDKPIDFELK